MLLLLLLLYFRYIIDETELIINDVQDEDEGVYSCEVITSLDMAEASGSLTVVGMTFFFFFFLKSMEQKKFLHYRTPYIWTGVYVNSTVSLLCMFPFSRFQIDRTLLPCCRSLSLETTQ